MTIKRAMDTGAAGTDWEWMHRRLDAVHSAVETLIEPDQDRQEQILRERAIRLAKAHPQTASAVDSVDRIEVLAFTAAGERYAFEASYVAQVCPVPAITPIPGVPNFVVGIVAIQGNVVSVIDLRTLLRLPLSGLTEPTSMIVLKSATMEFGILADEILGIERYAMESLERNLPTLANTDTTYLKGVTAGRTAILAAEQLLSDSRLTIDIS
jgi:purine-binding chemotaxis protein CheW